ncbi:MAG: ATP-binding protein [Bacilli bacterium]|nr:ATP-binding protein [Bacilli bacterium]
MEKVGKSLTGFEIIFSGSVAMHIKELFNNVLFENLDFEFKSRLDKEKTISWGKSLAAFANGEGGVIFIGANNDGIVERMSSGTWSMNSGAEPSISIQEICSLSLK